MSSQPKWSLGSWAYEWNANGSLHKIKRADGKVFTFKYDAFGRRISKKYLRREFLYIWDGNVLLHEIKKDYQLEDQLTTWIFQDFVPVAKLQGDKSYSIISDHIGTPLVAIDNEGVKVWERELDIYGKVRKETKENPNFVPFRYQGQYYDSEVDLCYNRFRYYDPNSGNYISQDPISLKGGNPTLYGYVKDTNMWLDILGLENIPTHLHHTIPREIYNPRSGKEPILPPHLVNDPDIKGRAGNPNRWEIPADEHIALHKRNRIGGDYNTRWKQELNLLDPDKSKWTKQDILDIRDKLTKEFGIDKYKPLKKDCKE